MSNFAKFVVATALIVSPALATDFKVSGTYSDATFHYLKISTGDLDGDGANDDSVIRLACSNSAISGAWIYAPRDVATGQASGKRMHKPMTITKEWGATTPQLAKGGSWDLATMKGAKTMSSDDWHAISVKGLDGACPAGKVSHQDLSFTK